MARFTSKKFPELTVKFSDGNRAKFTKGSAEVDDEIAERLSEFAAAHPDYEIEQVEGEEKPQTPKQRAVARAEELGLDTSGTQKDIEARIAAFEADAENEDDEDPENTDEDDENEDEADDEDADDDSDEDTSDEA